MYGAETEQLEVVQSSIPPRDELEVSLTQTQTNPSTPHSQPEVDIYQLLGLSNKEIDMIEAPKGLSHTDLAVA